MSKTIVFYDGVCYLCHGLIQFALKYDTKKTLYFSHLQSTFAAKTLAEWNDTRINFDTVYVLNQHQAKLYDRSRAVVEVLLNMGGIWRILGALLWVIPWPIRDLGYRLIARYRYAIFGKNDSCFRPPSLDRFID